MRSALRVVVVGSAEGIVTAIERSSSLRKAAFPNS